MKLLKPMSVLSLFYFIVGYLLFLLETKIVDSCDVYRLAVQILFIAIAYWIFMFVELKVIRYFIKKQHEEYLPSVYMGFKGARLILSLFALLICKLAGVMDMFLLVINILVFYLVTLLFITIFLVKKVSKGLQ
ncbi:MAG: hypothetical protein J6C15_03990 [Bacteroidaceae bacterium]|nr:hypothetical protein [Bacteroidaceae bacterium]